MTESKRIERKISEKLFHGVTNYDLFEQIRIVVERRQHLLSDVYVMLFLLEILEF